MAEAKQADTPQAVAVAKFDTAEGILPAMDHLWARAHPVRSIYMTMATAKLYDAVLSQVETEEGISRAPRLEGTTLQFLMYREIHISLLRGDGHHVSMERALHG